MNKFLSYITTDVWAIAENYMHNLVDNLKSEADFKESIQASQENFKSFSSSLGSALQMQSSGMRVFVNASGVASVMIDTMIMTRSNWITEWLGIVTVEGITNTIKELDASAAVRNIVLIMDTPGGMVTNVSQAVQAIEESTTPVDTFVVGSMQSLGVWIGSATRNIWATPTAVIGSVGAMFQARKSNDRDTITIVSNLSPAKNASPESAEGRAQILGIIDGMAKIMIGTIARGYDISVEAVSENFGQGASFIAEEAQTRGMIHGIAQTVDDFIKNIDDTGKISNISSMNTDSELTEKNNTEGHAMADTNEPTPTPAVTPVVVEPQAAAPAVTPAADPVAEAMARVKSIEALSESFSKAPANVQTMAKEIIDANKFEAGATVDSVSSKIVLAMNGAFENVTAGALEAGRAAAPVAATLPVGDEFNAANPADSDKAADDETVAALTSVMNPNKTK